MFIFLIFFLLILLLFLIIFNKMKFALYTSILIIITTLFIGSGILSSFLLNNLESLYSPIIQPIYGKNNAIIALGGGLTAVSKDILMPSFLSYSRINETTRLYHMCKKVNSLCTIIISGGDPHSAGRSEAEVYQDQLISVGIMSSDIILESRSMNTYQNAQFTSAILKSKNFDKVFLVTSGMHMKRASLYFSNFGINPVPAISDYIRPVISIIPSGYNFAITDFALAEHIGIMRLYVYNFLGWNKKH